MAEEGDDTRSAQKPSLPLPTRLQSTIEAHKGPVHIAQFNTSGKYFLTGGTDRQIHLFNATSTTEDIKPIKTYSAHSGTILGISIAKDNASFVSGGQDRNVLVWDVATGSIIRRFSAHTGSIHSVNHCGASSQQTQPAPEDVVLTAGEDGFVRFFDLRARGAWKPIMECKNAKDTILTTAAYQSCIWTGSVDGVVRKYDIRAGKLQEDTIDRPITSITPTKNGSSLLVSVLASSTQSQTASHIITDVGDGSHLQTVQGGPNIQYRCKSSFWANDSTIIAGDETGKIAAWDVLEGSEYFKDAQLPSWEKAHSKAVLWTECTAQDGGRMITTSADGTVKIWSCN
ncbi:WD40 repeat-like protein [Meira miltonrushii]|uniref:WD40 repeat-like protein n=1 Tax=Meira miltonrushii TaxID=1280837 RepID=A0A316VEJ3_9BASI|nr:WD40 repeat-like protein [Meira miltonrushii]PWN36002.1 WD40 repeat-like protein [Meira miltonrushii]